MYQIEVARTNHNIFLLHLDFLLSGIETGELTSQTAGNARECNFSKWLLNADASYRSLRHFGDVVQTHQHFHDQTLELVRLLKEEGQETARRYFDGTLRTVSVKLFDLLDKLQVDRRIQCDLNIQAESGKIIDEFPPDLLTGIKAIDEQHKELHALTYKLLKNAEERIYAEKTSELLSALNSLFITHFQTEESILKSKGFSDDQIRKHIAQHTHFLEELINLQLEAMNHAPTTAGDVYAKLMQWELDHMRTSDIYLKTKSA